MNNPLISVLMPVYNCEDYIGFSLNSIINQTYKNIEIIVVNDGSTDKTKEILESYNDKRLKIYSLPNGGVAKALNFGLNHCKGEYIARMDSDDISNINRIQLQYELMYKTRADLVWSNAVIIDEKGDYICSRLQPPKYFCVNNIKYVNFLVHPSVLVRKSKIMIAGGYNEEVKYGQDWLLWREMIKNGDKFILINRPLLMYRINDKSVTFKSFSMNKNIYERNALICQKNMDFENFKYFLSRVELIRVKLLLSIRNYVGQNNIIKIIIFLRKLGFKRTL